MFGPLLWWELVRLARRGDAARARVLFLYLLLLTLIGFVFWKSFSTCPSRLLDGTIGFLPVANSDGGSLALILLEVQLLLVAIVAPAYAASTISEEKDRQTLPLLLTTDLTDGEIVWGKVAGRFLFVLFAVLAGVPLLTMTLFLPGVDPQLLIFGYSLTVGTAFLSAAIGANAACQSPDSRSALVRAYVQSAMFVGGTLIPPLVLLSPFAMLTYTRLDASNQSAMLRFTCGLGYPLAQIVAGSALIASAARAVRRAGTTAGPLDQTAYPEPPLGRPSPIVLAPSESQPQLLPPLEETNPILWKERYTGRAGPFPLLNAPGRWFGALFTAIAITSFVTGGWLVVTRAVRALDPGEAERLAQRGPEPLDLGGAALIVAGTLAAGLYLLPLTVGIAGCVARERQRGTLDSLLATPLSCRSILWSKLRAHAESGLVFGVGAITGIGCGFGADGGSRLGLAAMAATTAGFLFAIALTAWLSVRYDSAVRAFRLALPALLLVIGLPVLIRNLIRWNDLNPSIAVFEYAAGLCLVGALFAWWRAEVELKRG